MVGFHFAYALSLNHVIILQSVRFRISVSEHIGFYGLQKIRETYYGFAEYESDNGLLLSAFTPFFYTVECFIGLLMTVESCEAHVTFTTGTEADTWCADDVGTV